MKPNHPNIIEFEVYGDYALFSDPIMRVGGEKCSYQIPTYEALKGILHSIYWKPTLIWFIDAVRIINQIQMEVKGVRPLVYTGKGDNYNDLSFYTYLKQCRYQVKAHFEWNDKRPELACDRNENKHHQMAKRMIERGGRRDIFLGSRECQGYVEPCIFGNGQGFYDHVDHMNFGMMLHGITYPDEAYSSETENHLSVRFWNPVMENGIIIFPKPQDCPYPPRIIRKMKMKTFVSGINYNNSEGNE